MNSNIFGDATVKNSRWEDDGKGVNPIDWEEINNNQYNIDKTESPNNLMNKTKA